MAKPAAKVTACCSAIPTSKVLSGKTLLNASIPVPDGIAAVIPTILLSFFACSINVFANTFVKAGALVVDFCWTPVWTSNFVTPWYLSSDFSAKLYPFPFWVFIWISIGPLWLLSFAFFKIGNSTSKSWPSIGPT